MINSVDGEIVYFGLTKLSLCTSEKIVYSPTFV